jgi:hypothetical protein
MLVGTRFAYVDIETREEMAMTPNKEETAKQDHGGWRYRTREQEIGDIEKRTVKAEANHQVESY